jgi:hypothetical protein
VVLKGGLRKTTVRVIFLAEHPLNSAAAITARYFFLHRHLLFGKKSPSPLEAMTG